MSPVKVVGEGVVVSGRVCLLLAGVHNGGDNALARVLRQLGVDIIAPDESAFTTLNSEILASAGAGTLSVEPFNAAWYDSPRYAEFHARAVDLVRAHFPNSFLFALSDLGVARLVPFWRSVLAVCGVSTEIISYYEDPEMFAPQLGIRAGIDGGAGRLLWLGHALDAERSSRGLTRTHVTLEGLLEDWEGVIARLQQNHGFVWPAWSSRVRTAIVTELLAEREARHDVAVRPQSAADDPGRWAQDVFWRWARDGEDERGHVRLGELAKLFDEARNLVGGVFDTIVDLGDEVSAHRNQAVLLRSRTVELQQQIDALSAIGTANLAQLAEMRDALAQVEAERDRLKADPDKEKDDLARMEARWASVFLNSRQSQEMLTEQNVTFQTAIAQLSGQLQELDQARDASESEVATLRLIETAQKAKIEAAVAEADRLRNSLEEAEKGLAEVALNQRSRNTTEGARGVGVADGESGLFGSLMRRNGQAGGAKRNPFLSIMPKSMRKAARHRQWRDLVLQSGLFDPKFYEARYPDVVAAGLDLLDHFIKFGGSEGRHPSEAFNSKWYLSEYPDIREAGINPLIHYLENGRDEGRRRRALTDSGNGPPMLDVPVAVSPAKVAPASALAGGEAQANDAGANWRARETGWKSLLNPLFGKRATIVSLDELATNSAETSLALGGTVIALAGTAGALDRLALFAALRPELGPVITIAGEPVQTAPAHALITDPGLGIEQLADGWFDGPTVLNLRFAGGIFGVGRAFQFDHSGALVCVAEAMLAGTEADLVEVRLLNPLNEVLVILCGYDGDLYDSVVIPFPSLMRGGLHHGELAVLQTAPGGVMSLADYTRSLAIDLLGWPDGAPSFAISRVHVDMRGAVGTEPIFRPDVLDSLSARFGVAVMALEGSVRTEQASLASSLGRDGVANVGGREAAGATLVVPSDMLPSIYSIAGRRAPHDLSISRFAVVDSATLKPRADISMPYRQPELSGLQQSEMPAHAPYVCLSEPGAVSNKAGTGAPVFPLAIRHFNKLSWQADPLIPVAPDQIVAQILSSAAGGEGLLVTAIIDAGYDDAVILSCITALTQQMLGDRIEIILAGWADDRPVPDCGRAVRTFDGRDLGRAARLNAAASLAGAPYLLFLDPVVLMADPRTLPLLVEIANLPNVATAACALVTELEDEDSARVHSAGYFPTRISLCGDPVFDFDQVDVAKVIPAATYPVAANHMKCCVISAAVWGQLSGFDASRFPAAMFDLDFGNRALAAGMTNFCTTLVRAATDQVAAGADFPDPLAHRSIRPADWQPMFDSVTVIREMRR